MIFDGIILGQQASLIRQTITLLFWVNNARQDDYPIVDKIAKDNQHETYKLAHHCSWFSHFPPVIAFLLPDSHSHDDTHKPNEHSPTHITGGSG